MNPYWWAAGGVALLGVVGIAAATLLGRRGRIDSAEEAAEAADRLLPGFVTAGAVVGADGSGALAVTETGRVAALARVGRKIAVREVAWTSVRSTPAGIVIDTGSRRPGQVTLAGVDALDIRRLTPHLTRAA